MSEAINERAEEIALAAAADIATSVPSEVAPLSAWILADIIAKAGLPAGVFNMISGLGPVVGEALASHKDVDMVSFTGSVRAGTRVAALAAPDVKRVTLELGGKSPNVVLDGVEDIPKIVQAAVTNAFLNSGQTCSALTRLIVPRQRLAEVEDLAKAAAEGQQLGDPTKDETCPRPDRVGRSDTIAFSATFVAVSTTGLGWWQAGSSRRRVCPRATSSPRPVLLRQPGERHRPGGDLWPGAGDHSLRQ